MTIRIRPARAGDREALAVFTTDTFSWGDYVLDKLDRWLEDPSGAVRVAVDDADTPIAVARGALLSPTEAWLQGTRVHPDWRRKGVGTLVGDSLVEWVRDQGALVARLAIEDWNEAARSQVETVGMRKVASFVRARREISGGSADTKGNGGKRVKATHQLEQAPAAEADAAFVSWSTSELCREVRGLFAIHWTWRRLTHDDIATAATHGALWTAGGAWMMGGLEEEAFEVGWCDATPDRAPDLARAIVDLAEEQGAVRLHAMVPSTTPIRDAFERAGCELDPIGVYAVGL